MKKFVKILSLLTAVVILVCSFFQNTNAFAVQKGRKNDMLNLYVDANGSDSNSGTKSSPFKTLEKARDYVRTINKNMTEDIVVNIGEGTFLLNETLTFSRSDSGTNGYSIIYKGCGQGKTVISGGTEISGWSLFDSDKNIYEAVVPDGIDFRQLYINGEKAVRARSGQIGTYETRILGAERMCNGEVLPELLAVDNELSRKQANDGTIYIDPVDNTLSPEWKNINDVELHIFTAWCANILRLASIAQTDEGYAIKVNEEAALLAFNRQHPNLDRYYGVDSGRFIYYTENAYELIDEENEWYLDKTTNTVYLKVAEGVNINEENVVVPRLETLIDIFGTPDENVKNINFEDVTFAYSTWLKPSIDGLVDGQAMQYVTRTTFATNDVGVGRTPSAISACNSENIIFNNVEICNMGACGIDFHFGDKSCKLINSYVHDISSNAVAVGKFAEDDNIDYHVPYDPADSREVCSDIRILNNEITKIGTDYESAVAVACGYPKNILIANNTIYNVPYSGISVGFGWTKSPNAMNGNRILRNEIYDSSNILCDAGGIYTLSEQPNSKICDNYIHNISVPEWADYGTCGIYLDEGTGGYFVYNNIIEKAMWISPHDTGENFITNNYVDNDNVIEKSKALRIKSNAGAQSSFDEEELLKYADSLDKRIETEKKKEKIKDFFRKIVDFFKKLIGKKK